MATNSTSVVVSPELYQIILGCSTFFLVLPFVLIPLSRYPLGSTGAVLIGAFLMVVTTVIGQSDVYQVIGETNNLKTIFLLWGMMIISLYFEREQLIDQLLNKVFPPGLAFHWSLLRLSVIDALLAALFTNDVACVILTPLVLKLWIDQQRDRREVNTVLLTLATQANIGSTLTIFGNPQMALMASTSNSFLDPNSRLQLKTCVIYLWLPVFVVWFLNLLFLFLSHRLTHRHAPEPEGVVAVADEIVVVDDQPKEAPVSLIWRRLARMGESYRLGERSAVAPEMVDRSASVASFAESNILQPSHSRLFRILLFLILLVVIALLFASSDKVEFDIGLVPVGAGILLLALDTLINHQSPLLILSRVDWNVLLLFFGLFVWLDGLNSTGIPHRIWVALNLDSASLTDFGALFRFYGFTVIGSNVFSNVPLTLLVLQQLPLAGDHLGLILQLAFLTTIAGNLTLFGSVANLIVAQKALLSPLKHRFKFWTYLKYGLPSTLLLSLIGMLIIYGMIEVIH